MDEFPDLPDNTFYTKLYNIDMDTSAVQRYCQETPPFNYPFYDCETWAKGMLHKVLHVRRVAVDKVSEKNRRLSKENVAAPANLQSANSMIAYPGYDAKPPGAAPVESKPAPASAAATQERKKVSKKKAKKDCC